MTILVDMDDTIENLSEIWVSYLNEKYGLSVNLDDVNDWNMAKFFPDIKPSAVYEALNDRELWEKVTPLPGAQDALLKLKEDGHEVYIVTSSYFTTVEAKVLEVLEKYFPFIPWNHVIICSNKQMIRGDVMIDDAPHNLIDGDYIRIMPTAPHNRGFNAAAHGICRVDSWEETLELIEELSSNDAYKKSRYIGVSGCR